MNVINKCDLFCIHIKLEDSFLYIFFYFFFFFNKYINKSDLCSQVHYSV